MRGLRSPAGARAGASGAGDFVSWRVHRLRQAGFDPSLAIEIARDGRFDLHALLELVDRGCPARLAARILAPLD